MKILICSKLFYPSNSIGAVRPSNFAKYLAELGHEVVVVTEESSELNDYKLKGVEIIRTSNSSKLQGIIKINESRIKKRKKESETKLNSNSSLHANQAKIKFLDSLKVFLKVSYSQFFMLLIEYDWAISSFKTIKSKFSKKHFDIVLSSFGPCGSYFLGFRIHKFGFARYWVSDLRDNMVNEDFPFWLNLFYKNAEKNILRLAHIITLVSEGQKAMFINNNNKRHNNNKIYVVNNGYENNYETKQYNETNQGLTIGYTGQLYSGKRDFSMLLHVIDDLIKENIIEPKWIKIIYAGPSSEDLKIQLSHFNYVIHVCKDLGNVSREMAKEIQSKCDLLVVLTWNSNKEQGILTGKFFEYLQASKPIISLTCGNLANGELSQLIKKLNLGISCEYITYEADYFRLKKYIQSNYQSRLNGQNTSFNPNLFEIQNLHYFNISKKLNEIFLKNLS